MNNLAAIDKKYIWHPFTQMRDWLNDDILVIENAKGAYLRDAKGRVFLDGVSSLWVNIHGHRKSQIDAAIKKQLGKVAHTTFLGLTHQPAIKLAHNLVKIAPAGLNKVFYSDSGSTSVEIALKMSFQYWRCVGKKRKTRFIYFENSYHGDTIGAVSVGGIDLFHKLYHPLLFKAHRLTFDLGRLESFLRKNHSRIAALIIEPMVQGAAGMLLMPKGFLKGVKRLCRRYNVLFIADEVATGFGRTGKMFACEHENVSPDLLCLGKGLSGGYLPLAATLATNKIYTAFLGDYQEQKAFFHGHTYTANPLACAAALANLELFKKEKILDRLAPKIAFLKDYLRRFDELEHVGQIRQLGFMVGIELLKDKRRAKPYLWEEKIGIKVIEKARKMGAILRPLGNVIVLMPPLSIKIKELKKLLNITYQSIISVTSP